MSEAVVHHTIQRKRSPRGQSLVEFALVLPMLLVLLLGIADFGRVFPAGITIEAAARNAAEAAAQEYLRIGPGSPARARNEPAPRCRTEPDYNGNTYYQASTTLPRGRCAAKFAFSRTRRTRPTTR